MGESITSLALVVRVAFLVLFERFLLRLAQNRVRPRVLRFFGLLQTLVDRRKLFLKKFFGFLFFGGIFFSCMFSMQRVEVFWVLIFLRVRGVSLLYISFLNFRSLSLFCVSSEYFGYLLRRCFLFFNSLDFLGS